MSSRTLLSCIAFAVCMPTAIAATHAAPQAATHAEPSVAALSAAQIVDRNVAARGGLRAWQAVRAISMSGQMDVGGKKDTQLPFLLQMKRPRKTRFELTFDGKQAAQVYDGVHGWKVRPFLGRNDVEPYTSEELKMSAADQDLDGPLIDYAAKGTKVALERVEAVEGHNTYRLKLTMSNDIVRHVWVDAHSFLEVKIEGAPRRLDGKMHPVYIYFRDYKPVQGLMIPHVVETAVDGVKESRKMTLEHVTVNPQLGDDIFAEPQVLAAKSHNQSGVH